MAEISLAGFIINVLELLAVGFVVIFSALLLYIHQQYKYWEKKGIKGPKPGFIFGSIKDALSLKCTEAEAITAISSKYKDEKYVGIYFLWKPVLLVLDLELAKTIFEKGFEHFTDHPDIVGQVHTDSPLNSLFTMHGEVWKSRRIYFTKLFTPKKLREYSIDMQIGLKEVVKNMDRYVSNGEDVEALALMEPFAVYCIASAMYGLNLTNDKERGDMFLNLTHTFMHPPPSTVLKFLCYSLYPKLFSFLRVATLPVFHWDHSSKFTDELTHSRDLQGVDRSDCLSLVMNLFRNGSNDIPKIPFGEAVGHLYSFLQAGTHTSQTTACHVLLRLAEYPDVQEKLRNEVDTVMKGAKDVTYDHIKEMTYLDQIMLETQRMRPLLGTLKRTCTKDFRVDDNLTIKRGMEVFIDVAHIHMNPKHFPEPHLFKPERWTTGEAEASAFMAFGKGPRICIGKRFAEVEIKMAVATIISRYIIFPSDKMKPIKFDPQTLFITNIPKDGIWVKLRHRRVIHNGA